MLSSLELKDWIEILVGLSILIGIPGGILQRYFKATLEDMEERLTNSIKTLSLNIYADIKEESLVRKEQTRETIDTYFMGLESQIENHNVKLEKLSKDFKHYTEIQKLKSEALKESVLQDLDHLNCLICSIELYLESKNGYRRRQNIARHTSHIGLHEDIDKSDEIG